MQRGGKGQPGINDYGHVKPPCFTQTYLPADMAGRCKILQVVGAPMAWRYRKIIWFVFDPALFYIKIKIYFLIFEIFFS